jgi:SSS family solute:Na+ symporter
MGLFRLAVDTPVTLGMAGYADGYAEGSLLWIVNNIYFQYYSVLIFLVSAAAMVIVSHMSAAPDAKQLENLTFATLTEAQARVARELGHGRGGVVRRDARADPGGVPLFNG